MALGYVHLYRSGQHTVVVCLLLRPFFVLFCLFFGFVFVLFFLFLPVLPSSVLNCVFTDM